MDDEKPILDLMTEVLGASGWKVEAFSSPLEALNRAKRNKFDALILDVYMPELPGMLFHAKLKIFDRELAGRTVFVSGHFSRDELRRDLEKSAILLPKPFSPSQLVELVGKLLPQSPRSVAASHA